MFKEHFIVWMRPAGLPSFRKLWGRIETDLPVGQYQVSIYNCKILIFFILFFFENQTLFDLSL